MKRTAREKVEEVLRKAAGEDGVRVALTVPEHESFGHFSTNVAMRVAQGRKPLAWAMDLVLRIKETAPEGFFEKVEVVPPGFINLWLSPRAIQESFSEVAGERVYGKGMIGAKRTVIVEYSSPNVAKVLSVGHLRNTVLGEALANVCEMLGYKVVRWNYLGDWGTQFGKLIAAYKIWGDKKIVEAAPLEELQRLYVRFHDEEKTSPELEKRGREEFKKLEDGDKENMKLWEWFRKESIDELRREYEVLGAEFDVWIGESFFNKEAKALAEELLKKRVAERSEGAVVIRLDEFNLPPGLIEKSDGATVYLARDIANLRYRLAKYRPARILYVIGNEQAFQFEQLFAIAGKLGMKSAALEHIKYGLVRGESGKKLSTREGNSVSMKDIVAEATRRARALVEEKSKDLPVAEREDVARAVALGALKYANLKENRTTDILFDWDQMLDLAGDSGPYLQYTYARFASILRKAGGARKPGGAVAVSADAAGSLAGGHELALMRKIFEFPAAVRAAGERFATSILAGYLYKLAVAANKFYETTPVLAEASAPRRDARLALVAVAARTLRDGLALLGVETPEKI